MQRSLQVPEGTETCAKIRPRSHDGPNHLLRKHRDSCDPEREAAVLGVLGKYGVQPPLDPSPAKLTLLTSGCGIDVSLNAAIIFFVTSSDTRIERPSLSGLTESGSDEVGDTDDRNDMAEVPRPRRQDGTAAYLPGESEGIVAPRSNPFPTFKQHRPAPNAGASHPDSAYPEDMPTLDRNVSPTSDFSEYEIREKSQP